MSRRALRPQGDICHFCESILARKPTLSPATLSARYAPSLIRDFSDGRRLYKSFPNKSPKSQFQKVAKPIPPPPIPRSSEQHEETQQAQIHDSTHATEAELQTALEEVKATCNRLLSADAPSQKATNDVLYRCKTLAHLLVFEPDSPLRQEKAPLRKREGGPSSALLSLDPSKKVNIPRGGISAAVQRMIDELSQLSYSVIKSPPVYISPEALEQYVELQAILRKPETLPEVFKLYGTKPLLRKGSSPPKYDNQNPNKIANAIPQRVADMALQTAIDAKHLTAAMNLVNTSYSTKAFHRTKFLRKGLLPTTGLALAPAAAYVLASQFADLQDSMDPAMATKVAFVGMLAYVSFTGIIGFIAVTTANDQMVRVTWAPGVALRERWIREEERAAIDKIACSWGFKEAWRRGEEEGKDWDELREWIHSRAMMLDRVELMEGME